MAVWPLEKARSRFGGSPGASIGLAMKGDVDANAWLKRQKTPLPAHKVTSM